MQFGQILATLIGKGTTPSLPPLPPPRPLAIVAKVAPKVPHVKESAATLSAGLLPANFANVLTATTTLEEARITGYGKNPWVYTCTSKIARAASTVPWRVESTKGRDKELVEEMTPLEHLFEYPNPAMSRQDIVEKLALHLHLSGNAIMVKVRNTDGVVAQLWPVNPDYVTPVQSQVDYMAAYELKTPKDSIIQKGVYRTQDIIHLQFSDPTNPYWGMAPYEAASTIVASDSAGVQWNLDSFNNRVSPDAVIEFTEALSFEQWLEVRRQVKESLMSSTNAHLPAIMSGGAKWRAMSRTPIELDFIRSRQMSREEICAIFEVPPVIAGDLTRATYSNIKEAREIFWNDPVKGFLFNLQGAINRQLAPEFGSNRLVPDYETIPSMRTITTDTAEVIKVLVNQCGVPFDVVNRRLGLNFSSWLGSDVSYLPRGYMTAENVINMAPEVVPPIEKM